MKHRRDLAAAKVSVAGAALVLLLQVGCAGATPSPTAVPSPTPLAQPAPKDDLERVIEIRGDWGLRSDEDWIREVAADPNSIESELGILVTLEEAAELADMLRDPVARLNAYGTKNASSFGGLMIDPPGGNRYVMFFTGDLERHRTEATALLGAPRVEVRLCQFTESELKDLMDVIVQELGQAEDPQLLSVALDTRNNRVVVEAKSNTPGIQQDLETRYGPAAAVVIHPLPGPWANRESGAGWRLLASGILRGNSDEAYRVHVATTPDEWQGLWQLLDGVNEAPFLDLGTEMAVSFAHGIGSSCPEVRLDDVGFDFDDRVVYSVTSDPLAPRGCTDDLAGAAYFVVALDRATVPDSPFTVQLWENTRCGEGGCGGHPQEVTVDLEP